MKASHLPLKRALQKRMKDREFRFYFDESKAISELCAAAAHARQGMGLSQTELAKRAKTSQSVIARLENGNQGRMPSLDLLGRIAASLNLSLVVGFEKRRAA